jgi:hypothetical protein
MALAVVDGQATPSPLTAAPPGYGRAYASVSVQVSRQGVLRPAAHAQWRPLVPGTDEQYTGPLFGAPDAAAPLLFPQEADTKGLIQVWAPEPVRIEVSAWIDGYGTTRQVLDLLFTEDFSPEQGNTLWVPLSHLTAQNAHPLSGDYGNVIEWRPNGLFVPAGAVPPEYLTQTEGDLRYVNLTGDDMTGPLALAPGDGQTAFTFLGGAYGVDVLSGAAHLRLWRSITGGASRQSVLRVIYSVPGLFVDEPLTAPALTVDGVTFASLLTRLSALEAQVATLQTQMTGHLHEAGDWDYLAGAMVMPEDIP